MAEETKQTVAEIWWKDRIKRISGVMENEIGAANFFIAFTKKDGSLFTHCQGDLSALLCCMAAVGADLYRGVTSVQQKVQEKQAQTPQPVEVKPVEENTTEEVK